MGKWIAVGLFVVAVIFVWASYASLVGARNTVDKKLSDVGTAEQFRLDTVPKFVKTAQFSTDFQLRLNREWVQGREGIKDAVVSGNPAALQKAASDAFGAMMISVRAEAVPQAKLDQITELNAQIENAERVVRHERKAYNEVALDYNNKVQIPPSSLIALLFGFQTREFFKAEPGAEKSPDVELKLN